MAQKQLSMGGFFSKVFKPNVMIGPVLSQIAGIAGKFIPGNNSENRLPDDLWC